MVNTECPRLRARLAWCWSRLALKHSTNCWKFMGQLSGLTSWDGQNISQYVRYLRLKIKWCKTARLFLSNLVEIGTSAFFWHFFPVATVIQWISLFYHLSNNGTAFSVMKALWFCFRLSTVDPTASSKRGASMCSCLFLLSSFHCSSRFCCVSYVCSCYLEYVPSCLNQSM